MTRRTQNHWLTSRAHALNSTTLTHGTLQMHLAVTLTQGAYLPTVVPQLLQWQRRGADDLIQEDGGVVHHLDGEHIRVCVPERDEQGLVPFGGSSDGLSGGLDRVAGTDKGLRMEGGGGSSG